MKEKVAELDFNYSNIKLYTIVFSIFTLLIGGTCGFLCIFAENRQPILYIFLIAESPILLLYIFLFLFRLKRIIFIKSNFNNYEKFEMRFKDIVFYAHHNMLYETLEGDLVLPDGNIIPVKTHYIFSKVNSFCLDSNIYLHSTVLIGYNFNNNDVIVIGIKK